MRMRAVNVSPATIRDGTISTLTSTPRSANREVKNDTAHPASAAAAATRTTGSRVIAAPTKSTRAIGQGKSPLR